MTKHNLSSKLTQIQMTLGLLTIQLFVLILLYSQDSITLIPTFILGILLVLSNLLMITIQNKQKINQINTVKILSESNDLADQTQSILKQGLDQQSAKYIVEIVKNISNAPAVSITDKENVLSFIGEGCDMHPVGYPIRTQATLDSIQDGKLRIIENKVDFSCKLESCKCPLETAIIVPLKNQSETIGCLKLYGIKKASIKDHDVKLAIGIGKILSRQIELANIEMTKQLIVEARLEALEAQINPHFLFNALNAINMYIIKDSEIARDLILKLSSTLRYTLGKQGKLITVKEELDHIEDFLAIENARYENKLELICNVDKDTLDCKLPILAIHPLVNNAVTHGILPTGQKGKVTLSVSKDDRHLHILVKDDGIGIKAIDLPHIYEINFGQGCGIGIPNVDGRLKLMYGDEYGLRIDSTENQGTVASFSIPLISTH